MAADGAFVITWGGVYAGRYNANGTPAGAPFLVNTTTTGSHDDPAVALDDDGNFVIVWSSHAETGIESIYAQRFAANGDRRGGQLVVNAAGGLSAHDYRRENADVAMDANGDFVVTWSAMDPDMDEQVMARRYNSQGTPQGEAFVVATGWHHSVAMDGAGNFAVVWLVIVAEDDTDIFARRFAANGQPNGATFRVNSSTDSHQSGPVAAMNDSGELYVAWMWDYREQRRQLEAGRGIHGRLFGANGVALGNDFKVNSYGAGAPYEPDVALDDEGEFLTVWSSWGQDGSGYGLYGQYNMPEHPSIPVLVSLLGDGRVRNLPYSRSDILKYDPATDRWSLFFDASNYGISKDLADFELLEDGDLLLIFKAAVSLPGAGSLQPNDIVRLDKATNTFTLYLDGSDVGLTTAAERLDALGMDADGSLLLSTTGGGEVGGLTMRDEDLMRFRPAQLGPNTSGTWSPVINGIWYGLQKDLWSVWADTVSDDLYFYMTVERTVTLHEIKVPANSVMRCRPQPSYPFDSGIYSHCLIDLYWDGTAAGLPAKARIDGVALLLP